MPETVEREARVGAGALAWWPGVADVVFMVILFAVLVGGRYRLLSDPGSFWHARLGRYVLESGSVPRADTLTFSREGTPWVDQSWLFDVGLAWVVEHAGWTGATALSALLLAGLYGAVARGLLRDGHSPIVAMVVAILAAGVGTIHFLVRPHLLTFVLFWAFLRICKRQHKRGGWAVAWLPFLSVFWANVHGGFLAGPVVVFAAGLGHAISGPLDAAKAHEVAKFGVAGLLCVAAALVNPYGVGLYRHVFGLLVSLKVTDLIREYQPIPFGAGDARIVEWVILALIAVPTFAKSRMSRYELTHALAWLHVSLSSVRNAPLFALAVAPGLATLLDGLFTRDEAADPEALAERSVWPWLSAVGLGVAVASGAWVGGFNPAKWPLAALPSLNRTPVESRLFHEQDWGGMVESECEPPRLAYIDDRFELFGRDEVLRYVNALEGGPDWDIIRDRDAIDLVWVSPSRPLARRLEGDPSWKEAYRDKVSVLFERVEGPRPPDRLAEIRPNGR